MHYELINPYEINILLVPFLDQLLVKADFSFLPPIKTRYILLGFSASLF